jgi:uncharacterized protein YwgA
MHPAETLTPILLVDDSRESAEAAKVLNGSGINYLVMNTPTEGKPTPPALLVDAKIIQGAKAIDKYVRGLGDSLDAESKRIKTTLAVLKHLGVLSSMSTFSDRLKMQKVIYLLQRFGLRTGWSFSWYLRGPYSSELTHAFFETNLTPSSEADFDEHTKRAIERFKTFFKPESMTAVDLEAAASTLYIAAMYKGSLRSQKELEDQVAQWKPALDRSKVAKYVSVLWNEIPHAN